MRGLRGVTAERQRGERKQSACGGLGDGAGGLEEGGRRERGGKPYRYLAASEWDLGRAAPLPGNLPHGSLSGSEYLLM